MSVPFYPPSVSTCVLWLDASDPATLTVSDGRATLWKDKSQFSNDTKVVSAEGPLISTINGLPSLFFQGASGSAQFFQGPLSSFSTASTSLNFYLTTFVVGTVETPSVPGFFPTCVGAGFRRSFYPGTELVQWSTPQANIAVSPHATSNSNYAAVSGYGQPFLVANAAYYNASTSLSFLNLNGYPTTRSDGANTLAALTISTVTAYSIGGSLAATTDFRDGWTGHIAEVIMYSNHLSWSQRQHVEGYLAYKWGLQNSLPPYHPFKHTPSFLTTLNSALYASNTVVSKNGILPPVETLSTQLLWAVPQNQQPSMSSFTLAASSNQYIDVNTSVQLNQTAQSALLVNNPEDKSWYVQSIAKNNLQYTAPNTNYTPYTQYPRINRALPAWMTSPIAQRQIGTCVAISSNGNYVLSGDPSYRFTIGDSRGGALFVFAQNAASGLYSTTQIYISAATFQSASEFGMRAAMTDDATFLIGTTTNFNQGVTSAVGYACVFKKSPTTDYWTPIQELQVPPTAIKQNLYLGKSVTMTPNGDYIFLGSEATFAGIATAGAAFPYKKRADTDYWDLLPGIFPPFAVPLASGFSATIAINSNATDLLIAASNNSVFANNVTNTLVGSVFYYTKDPSTDQWNFKQQLLPSDYVESYYFGYALAMARNSSYFVAKSYRSNSYVYKKSPTTDYWNFCYEMFPQMPGGSDFGGASCSISETGESIFITTRQAGTAAIAGLLYQQNTSTDIWYNTAVFYPSDLIYASNFGNVTAMTPSGSHIVAGRCNSGNSNAEGVYLFKQSTIGTTFASNSFVLLDTTKPIPTVLLPHPSTNPGQMMYIKDSGQQAQVNPICVSTTGGSFLNSTIYSMNLLDNNACLQLQSDGINQYTLVNYYSGTPGMQPNQYNFRDFWVKGSPRGPLYNYPIPIAVSRGNPISVVGFGIPQEYVLYDNIFFMDSDNMTPIPHWNEFTSNLSYSYGSNTFWVKIPYIPPWPMSQQYFMYWNCNSLYPDKPNEVFPFYDDFTGGEGASPDSNKWFITKQGSENGVASLTGFTDSIHLMGDSNTNANTNLLSKVPYLSTNFAISFTQVYSASSFGTVAMATTSTQQFLPTGGQSNWWWTTLGNGYTHTFSSLSRRFCFAQAENSAPVILGCNTLSLTRGLVNRFEFTYTDNGNIKFDFVNTPYRTSRTNVYSFTNTTYLESNKYIFFSQGSIGGLAAQSTILCNVFLRPYVNPEPFITHYNNVNVLQ